MSEESQNNAAEAEVSKDTNPVAPPIVNDSEEKMTKEMVAAEEKQLAAKMRAEKQYNAEYKDFRAGQDRILKAAEDKLPSVCVKCNVVVRNNKDKVSIKKNGSCIGCFFESESHRTQVAKDSLAAEETSMIAALDLSDYENWLFGDEMGQRTLSRIITKLKREGYDYKPWQVSIAAAAWSKDNYNDTSLSDTRHLVERVQISALADYIPQGAENIQEVIASVKRAEEIFAESTPQKTNIPWIMIGGASALAIAIPFLMRRR